VPCIMDAHFWNLHVQKYRGVRWKASDSFVAMVQTYSALIPELKETAAPLGRPLPSRGRHSRRRSTHPVSWGVAAPHAACRRHRLPCFRFTTNVLT
jgi:hypothetical protein